MNSFKIAVFVSGNGSNLQSLIDTNKIKNEAGKMRVISAYTDNKNKIDRYYDSNLWDKTKKIINPYELVYITNKKTRYRSVSTFEPLSRSFYKMIEMSHLFLKD